MKNEAETTHKSSLDRRLARALGESERRVFEGLLALDKGDVPEAVRSAYQAMLDAARVLVETELDEVPAHPAAIAAEFKARFFDTQRFFDPAVRGRFAVYFFRAHEEAETARTADIAPFYTREQARRRLQEALLFIDAVRACWVRVSSGVEVRS